MGKRDRNGSGGDGDGDGSGSEKISKRASTHKKTRSEDMEIKKLNDEAFQLSLHEACNIINVVHSLKEPLTYKTYQTYKKWNEDENSFFFKMCICFGDDFKLLAQDVQSACKKLSVVSDEKPKEIESKTKEIETPHEPMEITSMEKTQLLPTRKKKFKIPEWLVPPDEETLKNTHPNELLPVFGKRLIRQGPLVTGHYLPGKEPTRIPYHLCLLVKEAVDNMDNPKDLERVEKKIRFFCTHFHSHLPTGWIYKRENASSLIVDYPTTESILRYDMTGFTPLKRLSEIELDKESLLSTKDLADVMTIIHSRKTPDFTKLYAPKIYQYYKLCSCFGIDYKNLEAASDDDVCLMNMGG